jgi:hypothetical protein
VLRRLHGKAPKRRNIEIFLRFGNATRKDASAHKNVKLFLRDPLAHRIPRALMDCTQAAAFYQLLIAPNRRNFIFNAFQVRCRFITIVPWLKEILFSIEKQSTMARRICMEPPKKDSEPTQENIQKLEQWLTSIIAGHPGATHTYTFYEKIDKYLGPWGEDGYPIRYGKRYNIFFTTDHNLRTNNNVQNWIWKTSIKLQEELRDFIVQAYREGNLKPTGIYHQSSKKSSKRRPSSPIQKHMSGAGLL